MTHLIELYATRNGSPATSGPGAVPDYRPKSPLATFGDATTQSFEKQEDENGKEEAS